MLIHDRSRLDPDTPAPPATAPSLLAGDLAHQGEALLHQQCWCWGRDIRREAGNVLLEHGFERWRPPEGETGSRMYSLARGDSLVVLWAFGLGYADASGRGLLVGRYSFSPLVTTRTALTQPTWRPGDLPLHAPNMTDWRWLAGAMPEALQWIAAYEEWVRDRHGAAHREACLAAWRQVVCPAETMAATWRAIAEGVRACLTSGVAGSNAHAPLVDPARAGAKVTGTPT